MTRIRRERGDGRRDGPQPSRALDARRASKFQVGNENTLVTDSQLALTPPMPTKPSWPVVVGEPPLVATAFQERLTAQVQLDASLRLAGSTTVITQVVAGDGGIGKTQLAARTFDRALATRGYDLYVWVTAVSQEAIATGYADALIRVQPDARADDPRQAARRFLAWLRGSKRSWLIVLDDVADPAHVAGWWPAGRTGRTLVTTRRRDAVLSEDGRTLIDLSVFEPAESLKYLTARLSTLQARSDALQGAPALADALGHLPLALAQATGVILDDGITCATYRERFTDRSATLSYLFPASADTRQCAVAATWSLATETADGLPPEHCSRPLLAMVAVLDPNGIPECVLTSHAAQTFIADQVGPASGLRLNADTLRAALRTLHRLSLISHDPEDSIHSVRMHALAQRAAREPLEPAVLQAAYRAAADALVEVWPEFGREGDFSQVLRQNTTMLAGHAGDVLWQPDGHPVLFAAGRSLGDVGLVGQAVNYWQTMLATAARMLGAHHPHTLAIRHSLARWQGQAGDALGAWHAFKALLGVYLRVLGPEDPRTLATRHSAAWWRGEARDPVGAMRDFEALLADRLRLLGPDHRHTLVTRQSLARWQGQAGNPGGARAAFEALLADYLRVMGPDHPYTLATRHDLAWWRGEAGDAADAAGDFEALVADRMRLLEPDHPYTLATRHDLAWWRGHAGDPAGATAMMEAVLADYQRVLGPDHPHTIATGDDLAWWRRAQDFVRDQRCQVLGQIRDGADRVPGDLPGLDFLQPGDLEGDPGGA